MKRKLLTVMALLFGVSLTMTLSSCGPTDEPGPVPEPTTYTVSYFYGTNVIHTEEVEEGEKAPEWDPTSTVTDKTFLGWFGEPTLTHPYDFSSPVTQDLSIFGSFVTYEEDTREWAVAGSGLTSLLKSSNWGKVFNKEHYMTKQNIANSNVYVMELNLFAGDQFQFTNPILDEGTGTYSWGHQRGGGYLVEPTRDGKEYFTVGGGLGADNYTSNITAKVDGRYKFTLTTYPAGDFQKDDLPEAYNNRNYYDTLEWERIGDSTEVAAETKTTFFMKGAQITNWANLVNDHTKMVETDGIHTLSNVYLKVEDEFMFASQVTDLGTGAVSEGNEFIRGSNLTEASKELVSGEGNMKVNETGYYTFTYDSKAKTLDVKKVTDYVPTEASYYLDGNFGGRNWGIDESLKLTVSNDDPETYVLANPIIVSEANQELGIQFYNKDLASPYVDFFASAYVAVANEAYDLSKTNIVFKTPGQYNVSINTYSHIVTITPIV